MLELVKFLKKSIIYYSKLSVSELTFLQKFSCGDVVEKWFPSSLIQIGQLILDFSDIYRFEVSRSLI